MRTRDEVLTVEAINDRLRELEAQQAASEPVAWALFLTDHESLTHFTTNKDRAAVWGRKAVPLYAHPSAAAVTVTEEWDRETVRWLLKNKPTVWAQARREAYAALTAASEGASA